MPFRVVLSFDAGVCAEISKPFYLAKALDFLLCKTSVSLELNHVAICSQRRALGPVVNHDTDNSSPRPRSNSKQCSRQAAPYSRYASLPYSSSDTGSSHSVEAFSPATSIARCENHESGAAPCQCSTFAGMFTTVPGSISTVLPSLS